MDKEEIISTLTKYNKLKELVKKILNLYDNCYTSYDVEYLEEEEDNIFVEYSYYCHGETFYKNLDIPFLWLNIPDNNELKSTIEEYKKIKKRNMKD